MVAPVHVLAPACSSLAPHGAPWMAAQAQGGMGLKAGSLEVRVWPLPLGLPRLWQPHLTSREPQPPGFQKGCSLLRNPILF